MGVDIKNLRLRIRSVDSTLHLTKAMGLVASSKIRRANDAMINGRNYALAVSKMINQFTTCPECQNSHFMKKNSTDRTRLIVIAGDRGLCGDYNSSIFRLVREYPNAEIIPIGKRAADKYKGEFISSEKYTCAQGYALSEKLCNDFAAKKYDRLGIISSQYISILMQKAKISWVLPLEKNTNNKLHSILFEPDEMQIFHAAITEYVSGILISAVRESFACEVAARRMAMDNAGKNAQQMIDDLKLSYNRARQSSITQEITEIVAGSGE